MKDFLKKLNSSFKSNKGSSIILVVITMMFVVVIGSALMFTSYIGVLTKSTEKQGKQNFYDAESAMIVVKTNISEIVNEAIEETYDEFLVNYAVLSEEGNINEAFRNLYTKKILNKLSTSNNTLSTPSTSVIYEYESSDILSDLASVKGITSDEKNALEDLGYYVSGEDTVSYTEEEIILNGISIGYEDNGFLTTVSTDIAIEIPDFNLKQATGDTSLFNFSVISEDDITISRNMQIAGSMFADNIFVGSNATLESITGVIVSRDLFSIQGGSVLNIEKSSEVWTNNLEINSTNINDKSTINVKGELFVGDDTILENNAYMNVSGSYIGFGDSLDTKEESSAIIINGENNTLALDEAQKIIIAGYAFVGDDIKTAESISIRGSQTAYLVPKELIISGSIITQNPIITTERIDVSLDTTGTILNGKTPASYNLTSSDIVSEIYPIGGGQFIQYFFYDFNSTEDKDEFYQDYFNENESQISIDNSPFLDIEGSSSNENIMSQGSSFAINDGEISYIAPNESDNYIIEQSQRYYENMIKTVSSQHNNAENPYEFLINEEEINDFIGSKSVYEFKDSSGEVVALLVQSGTIYLSSTGYPSVSLIVTVPDYEGLMYVFGDFDGTIISTGKINLSVNSMNSNADITAKALEATNNGRTFGTFFNDYVGNTSDEVVVWDIEDMVYYENWTKS